MKTSYFARMNSNSFKSRNLNGVSIARSARYWSGRRYAPLYPTWEMIKMTSQSEYEKVYRAEVLDKLDALQVYQDLGEDAVLLCHESAAKCESGEEFCHRHIVAKWLEEELWINYEMDIHIEELKDDKQDLKKVIKDDKQTALW